MFDRYPHYRQSSDRFDSFRENTFYTLSMAFELSVAGFFHIGIRNITVCYHCGLALCGWNTRNVVHALKEHYAWNGECCFIRCKSSGFAPTNLSRSSTSDDTLSSGTISSCPYLNNFVPTTSIVPCRATSLLCAIYDRYSDVRKTLFREQLIFDRLVTHFQKFQRHHHRLLLRCRKIEQRVGQQVDILRYADDEFLQEDAVTLMDQLSRDVESLENRAQYAESVEYNDKIATYCNELNKMLEIEDTMWWSQQTNATKLPVTTVTTTRTHPSSSFARSSEQNVELNFVNVANRLQCICVTGQLRSPQSSLKIPLSLSFPFLSSPPPPTVRPSIDRRRTFYHGDIQSQRSDNDTSTNDYVVSSTVASQTQVNRCCVVCLCQAKDTIFLPCRHTICCKKCASMLVRCPLCRATIFFKIWAIL